MVAVLWHCFEVSQISIKEIVNYKKWQFSPSDMPAIEMLLVG